MHSFYTHIRLNSLVTLLAVAGCDSNGCYANQNGESLGETGSTSVVTSIGESATRTTTEGTTVGETTRGETTVGETTRGDTDDTTTGSTGETTTTGGPECNDLRAVDDHCKYDDNGSLLECDECVRFVFVTGGVHTGSLGGLDGADEICQGLTKTAFTNGKAPWLEERTFKAWLSTNGSEGVNAVDRLEGDGFEGKYVKVEKGERQDKVVVVADGWNGLVSDTHQAGITRTESGLSVKGGPVWTNTKTDGYSDGPFDCDAWEFEETGKKGRVGQLTSYGAEWTELDGNGEEPASCATELHLYCIEVKGEDG